MSTTDSVSKMSLDELSHLGVDQILKALGWIWSQQQVSGVCCECVYSEILLCLGSEVVS